MSHIRIQAYTRLAGILLLLTIFAGWFGEMYVPSIMLKRDVASTAAQLSANAQLFRLGFATYMLEAISDIVLTWIFYVLLKPVHRHLAVLSALFGLVSMSLFAVTKMFYFAAPMFLGAGTRWSAFSPEQLETFATISLSLYAYLSGLTMVFYGVAWLLRGYLTWRSEYLPRVLGGLMIAAGVGFITKTITYILAPAYSWEVLLAPMFLNAVVVALWMLAKGVNQEEFTRAVRNQCGNSGSTDR